jgi:mono/diheme cytochrome c family protein
MKRSINLFGFASVLAGAFMVLSAFKMSDNSCQGGVWKAPVTASKMENPLKGDDGATSKGKKLYKQMCAICHGDAGKGDGMAGSSLNPRPANFTSSSIQSQTDGEIYWKLTEGRAPMASYKAILKDNQRWQLVNYIRTFKK